MRGTVDGWTAAVSEGGFPPDEVTATRVRGVWVAEHVNGVPRAVAVRAAELAGVQVDAMSLRLEGDGGPEVWFRVTVWEEGAYERMAAARARYRRV